MAKYRKKPVVIEAFQMTAWDREHNDNWPEWLNRAWNMNRDDVGFVGVFNPNDLTDRTVCIVTLEGTHQCRIGDYIIQGIKGELYPCKPDIFAATYEEAGE